MTDYSPSFNELPTNPKDIVVNYTSAKGSVSAVLGDFDNYMKTIVVLAIVFGTRIGLSALAFPVTFIITKNRKSPIFILNIACLVILFLQSSLYAVTLTKTYNTISYRFSMYGEIEDNVSNISVASNVLYIILIILVELSFCYQVYIIFDSPQKNLKRVGYLATLFAISLGVASVALYFIYMVYSNLAFFNNNVTVPQYLVNTPLILFATSSCTICLMLSLKLAYAIRTRRYLGLRQFSLFHILFIMAFQTMFIPTILILISFNAFSSHDRYSSQTFSALGSALITLSLPLTTMWANSAVSASTPSSTFNMQTAIYTSSDDNKTIINVPRDYDPEVSSKFDTESNEIADPIQILGDDTTMHAVTPATQDDKEFWKEVEMYTKDLDKLSTNGSLLDERAEFK